MSRRMRTSPVLCPVFQLARHNKELQSMLKPGGQVDGDEALEFYAKHTAQIEVKQGPGVPAPAERRAPHSGLKAWLRA